MKKLTALLTGAVLSVQIILGQAALAGSRAEEIRSLIKEHPAPVGMHVSEDGQPSAKKLISLYDTAITIAELSDGMDAAELSEVESEVRGYISDIDTAVSDASDRLSAEEKRQLAVKSNELNQKIDSIAPDISAVDEITAGRDFKVRIHSIYKSDNSRSVKVVFINTDRDMVIDETEAELGPNAQNVTVVFNAGQCSAGETAEIYLEYEGVSYRGRTARSVSVKVKADTRATAAPTAAPLPTEDAVRTASADEEPSKEIESADNTDQYRISAADDWAADEIMAAISGGLVPESLYGQYKLYATRAQFCELAATAVERYTGMSVGEYAEASEGERVTFCDISLPVIEACARLGIVNGYEDGSFRPENHIRREEAAAMLARCAKLLGMSDKSGVFIFDDNDEISSWARGHVRFVNANGIMTGDDNKFMPQENYTVEQAILTFNRMYERLIG